MTDQTTQQPHKYLGSILGIPCDQAIVPGPYMSEACGEGPDAAVHRLPTPRIHTSIVQRACDILLWHPSCPPMPDGVEGLAAAMEAALEAVRADLDPIERFRGEGWVAS